MKSTLLFIIGLLALTITTCHSYEEEYDASSTGARYIRSTKGGGGGGGYRKSAFASPSRARISSPAYQPQQQRFEQSAYGGAQSQVPSISYDGPEGQPEPYSFNYEAADDYGGNSFRKEESDSSGTVRGSYGYTDANGLYRVVDYVADQDGFHATIRTNEPGLAETNPTTGQVENPADVQLNAEAVPAGVRQQQASYKASGGGHGGGGGFGAGSSYGGGHGGGGGGFSGGAAAGGSYGGGGSSAGFSSGGGHSGGGGFASGGVTGGSYGGGFGGGAASGGGHRLSSPSGGYRPRSRLGTKY